VKRQMIFVLLTLAILASLLGCWAYVDRPTKQVREDGDTPVFRYEIVYLEGMPCLYIEKMVSGYSAPAITCDWSEWSGGDQESAQ